MKAMPDFAEHKTPNVYDFDMYDTVRLIDPREAAIVKVGDEGPIIKKQSRHLLVVFFTGRHGKATDSWIYKWVSPEHITRVKQAPPWIVYRP